MPCLAADWSSKRSGTGRGEERMDGEEGGYVAEEGF